MKKIIRSFIITLVLFGSIVSVSAYGKYASCQLNWLAGFARSSTVGYSKSAYFSGTNYDNSISIMRLEAWASWEGAIYPWTREGYINIAPGKIGSFTEPMSRSSVFRVELRPADNTYRANGSGFVNLN